MNPISQGVIAIEDPTPSPSVLAEHGRICDRISTRLVAVHKEHYGVGPREARTYWDDDLLVCLFRGGYTRVEESLRRAGRTEAVIDQRAHWQEIMRPIFQETVEKETGRTVIGFISGNQQDPDIIAELFVLERE